MHLGFSMSDELSAFELNRSYYVVVLLLLRHLNVHACLFHFRFRYPHHNILTSLTEARIFFYAGGMGIWSSRGRWSER